MRRWTGRADAGVPGHCGPGDAERRAPAVAATDANDGADASEPRHHQPGGGADQQAAGQPGPQQAVRRLTVGAGRPWWAGLREQSRNDQLTRATQLTRQYLPPVRVFFVVCEQID